jgi:hypothetical protein
MKILLVLVVVVFACTVYAHGTLMQKRSYEFYDRAGVVSVDLDESNTLTVRLNTFEIGKRQDFCQTQ